MRNQLHTRFNQRGSALIVALTILLVLTLLGVSAMQRTSLQEKLAGNARDQEIAFESAEAALRAAESYLDSLVTVSDFSSSGGTGGLFTARTTDTEAWEVEANWSSAINVSGYSDVAAKSPQYIIQVLDSQLGVNLTPNVGGGYTGPPVRNVGVFQITARGYGNSPNSRVMLQSYYGRLE